jgi:hypothetical protein
MADVQLTLTGEEYQYLRELLEAVLKEKSVEEHRTRAPLYRQHVLEEENRIRGLLTKLRQPSGGGEPSREVQP